MEFPVSKAKSKRLGSAAVSARARVLMKYAVQNTVRPPIVYLSSVR